jgi:hypothetical protein
MVTPYALMVLIKHHKFATVIQISKYIENDFTFTVEEGWITIYGLQPSLASVKYRVAS